MKRRTVCLLSALCLLFALLGGCQDGAGQEETPQPTASGGGEQESRQMALPVDGDASLHPALTTSTTNFTLAPLLYEGLFALDETFSPQMVLCQSYLRNDEGTRWQFTLRPGVTWSDGTAFTAADAAAALNAARGEGSRYQKRLAAVSSITAEGDYTVIITLSAATGNLPALLDIPLAKDTGTRPAGTGPYELTDGDAGMVLTRRSGWWGAEEHPTAVETIALMDIAAADDLLYAFDTREIDLVVTDFTGSDALGFSSDYAVWEYDTTRMIYLGFRAVGNSPCTAPALRNAISKAIDRQALVNGVFAHHAKAASLPVSPASPLYDATLGAVESDGGAALSALERVDKTLKLLVCNENTFKVSAADRIAEMLRGYGLAVEVEKCSFEAYVEALQAGKFDLYLGEISMMGDFDPTALVGTGRSLNYGGYSDAGTDARLAEFRTAHETNRIEKAKALYEDLNQKTPIAPLCFKSGSVLTQWDRIGNLAPTASNVFWKMDAWTF